MVAFLKSIPKLRSQHGRALGSFAFLAAAVILSILITHGTRKQPLNTATLLLRREEGQDCRLVRQSGDQCKYVKERCPDEEAGLFSYLQLYYCGLDHAHGFAIIILVLWLCLLFSTIGIAASDFFSINLSTIAALLGLSENLAGVTFLAFGNGSPDVFSTFAAMSTHSGSLAVGELIGAAGFITAVVSGSMAIVRPFEVSRASFVRDIIFFICAAALAMAFLLDGQLLMWECALMIGFYFVYVAIVVAWHWISGRRTARRVQEATARQQFATSGNDRTAEPVADRAVGARRSESGYLSQLSNDEQFRLLEMAGLDDNGDEAEEQSRKQAISEINQNMRVNRSRIGTRRATRNAIRPSLVGALEFRAVLSSLEKSRNQQASPINLRRYSDDPGLRHFRPQNPFSPMASEVGINQVSGQQGNSHLAPHMDDSGPVRGRNRAASANDVATIQSNSTVQGSAEQSLAPRFTNTLRGEPVIETGVKLLGTAQTGLLQPPSGGQGIPSLLSPEETIVQSPSAYVDPGTSDGLPNEFPRRPSLAEPGLVRRTSSGLTEHPGTAGSSPLTAFPPYHDDPNVIERPSRSNSIRLPPPSLGLEFDASNDEPGKQLRAPIKWWPYRLLPAPQELFSTLFPTVYSWPQRNIWERLIGISAAPSVFLLTITLPVVEERPADEESNDYEAIPGNDEQQTTNPNPTQQPPLISIEGPPEPETSSADEFAVGRPTVSAGAPDLSVVEPSLASGPTDSETSPPEWNRWLVCTQIIMAPLFVTLLFWANMDSELLLRNLALAEAYSMIGALLVLALVLYTTSPDRAPRYRSLLSFVGFVVSVAWISTIANEVVGVLKALGVIFGISDAILGLTIFAVGNSLGDLVADITVAKLGYPVMALGACIGGPMLNILLGIGIGGLYMTIRDSKSGDGDAPFVPYHIQVGGTLVISAIALLITLVGLLIVVPMNKWIMDRKIGLGLIGLWCVSTLVNVVLEVTGIVTSVEVP